MFKVYTEKTSSEANNIKINCISQIKGIENTIGSTQSIPTKGSVTDIKLRIILSPQLGSVIGEYNLNGLDWITVGAADISSFTNMSGCGLTLCNQNQGSCSATFNYFKVYSTAKIETPVYSLIQNYESQKEIIDYTNDADEIYRDNLLLYLQNNEIL